MRFKRTLIVAVVCFVMAFASIWVYSQVTRGSHTLSPQDYIEIQQLYALYTRAVDAGPADGSAILQLFTPDAVFYSTAQNSQTVGHKDLQAWAANLIKSRPKNGGDRHWYSNLVVTPSPEGANATVYVMTLSGHDSSKPISIGLYGTMDDTLVKTREGWRFKRRVYYQDAPLQAGSR